MGAGEAVGDSGDGETRYMVIRLMMTFVIIFLEKMVKLEMMVLVKRLMSVMSVVIRFVVPW